MEGTGSRRLISACYIGKWGNRQAVATDVRRPWVSDRLIDLFAEEFDVGTDLLNDESSPETVEQWDSLAAVRLVAAIEAEFTVRLSTAEIMKMRSIGLARAVLKSKGAEI
jgi:acyl carrier protein